MDERVSEFQQYMRDWYESRLYIDAYNEAAIEAAVLHAWESIKEDGSRIRVTRPVHG